MQKRTQSHIAKGDERNRKGFDSRQLKLCSQDDVYLIEKKDYIKNPKPNGYRSLHLILEIPIFLTNEKRFMRVEVQFRTIAMDFWASLEHKLKYKKQIGEKAEGISEQLRVCAEEISRLDKKMQDIHNEIVSADN